MGLARRVPRPRGVARGARGEERLAGGAPPRGRPHPGDRQAARREQVAAAQGQAAGQPRRPLLHCHVVGGRDGRARRGLQGARGGAPGRGAADPPRAHRVPGGARRHRRLLAARRGQVRRGDAAECDLQPPHRPAGADEQARPRGLADGRRHLRRPRRETRQGARHAAAAADARGEGTVRPPRRRVRRAGEGRLVPQAAPRPRRDAGRDRADGGPSVHLVGPADDGSADDDPLRPPDRRGQRRHRGPRHGEEGERGGLRLPLVVRGQVRDGLLEARCGHHPPDRARELRLPRRPHDRHRLAYAQCGRPRHGGDRRRRSRRCGRDGGDPVGAQGADGHRCQAHGEPQLVDDAQGRHPQGGRPPHRLGRHRRDHRVPWAGRRLHLSDGHGDDLQHGRGDRRDDLDLPLLLPPGGLPARDGPRRRRRRRRTPPAQPGARRGVRVRPGGRDRPGHARAAHQRPVHPRPVHSGR